MIPMTIQLFLPSHSHDHDIVTKDVPAVPDEEFQSDIVEDKKQNETTRKYNYQLIFSLVLGDALCNFADGIFVGLSLLQCDTAVTMSVIGGVIYHEISQEVTDYFLLTTEGGLSPLAALVINFIGGLSVCLGGIVVFATSVSDMGVGVGLAMACGVYIHISCSEVYPRLRGALNTRLERFVSMLVFVLGVVPLGLVLLNHVHCHADHDQDHDHNQ
jgi:zinc transporter ZupT